MSNTDHVPTPTNLLTTAEAAERLGVSVPTVNRWAADGTLPVAHQLPGKTGARLFTRSAVSRLARKIGAAA